jgi:hypothetical protein
MVYVIVNWLPAANQIYKYLLAAERGLGGDRKKAWDSLSALKDKLHSCTTLSIYIVEEGKRPTLPRYLLYTWSFTSNTRNSWCSWFKAQDKQREFILQAAWLGKIPEFINQKDKDDDDKNDPAELVFIWKHKRSAISIEHSRVGTYPQLHPK